MLLGNPSKQYTQSSAFGVCLQLLAGNMSLCSHLQFFTKAIGTRFLSGNFACIGSFAAYNITEDGCCAVLTHSTYG